MGHMEHIKDILDVFLHLDHHISNLQAMCGSWTYVVLFLIIFCETGLVIIPFLPGDSLLFVLGALCASGTFNILILGPLLLVAAVLGNTINYLIGTKMAHIIENKEQKLIDPKHLQSTHQFFEKYGSKAIVLTRFLPILRTIAPFLAGVGKMDYRKFTFYNFIGGFLWVTIGLGAGWLFGQLPWVKENFSLVVLAIVVISLIPAGIEFWKHKKQI